MEKDTDKGRTWKIKGSLQGAEVLNVLENTKQIWTVHLEKDTVEGSYKKGL